MKQYLISLLLFVTLFAVISCDEANPLIPLEDGELSLTTTPDGALIYLNGTSVVSSK